MSSTHPHGPNSANQPSGIIPWFTHNPVAANLLMLLVILLGALTMGDLRKEAFPSTEPDTITINIDYDSGSALQAEEGIAITLESELETVEGIKTMTTTSNASGVSVSLEKLSDYDIDVLMTDVKAKVDTISSFPSDAESPVLEKAAREEHALWLQLYGDVDRHTLQNLADNLKTELLADSDIGQVSISGWLDATIMIDVDEGRLLAYDLTLDDVANAINEESSNANTATLKNADLYLQIQSSEQAYQIREFSNLTIKTFSDGSRLLLSDLAKIRDTYDEDTAVLSRFNREDSIAVQVITTGLTDISDSVIAAQAVAEKWKESGRLPAGVELATWYDRSEAINQRLDLLIDNAINGVFWVFLMLAIFLNLSVALWVALGLPFIFFGTLFLMGDGFLGMSLNAFTTFGFIMALGIVVDDAVVVGESVYTERSKHGDNIASTIRGTLRVAVPTLFGVFTTVAACFALSNIEGRLGTLYAQFGTIVAVCLMLSIIESKLILPAHLAHLNTRPAKSRFWPMMLIRWVQALADKGLSLFTQKVYKPAINLALANRYSVLLLFIGIFVLVASMPFTGAIRFSFFPSIPGDTVRASLNMHNDVSYGQTYSILSRMENVAYETELKLRQTPDANNGILNIQVTSSSDQNGRITIELDSETPYSAKEFAAKWLKAIGQAEGAKSLKIQTRRGSIDALRIELKSSSSEELSLAATQVKSYLDSIEAVSGIEDNAALSQSQLNLSLTEQGRALGLTTQSLSSQILNYFDGSKVQSYQRNSDEVEVQLGYPSSSNANITDLIDTKIRLDDGNQVPLSSLANITSGFTEQEIVRIDAKRAVYISSELNKDLLSATELVDQIKSELVPELEQQFANLDISFAGEAQEQEETQSSMLVMFIMAMLIIYILLAIPLKSYVQPFLIMMAIPFGVIGAMLGHWSNDLALGILSFNGIIALSGVVVNDSLLLASRFNELKLETASITEAINQACRDRVRAVLLTSITTFVGLMPLLGETSRQAQFLIPAAVSLAYGILYATAITLILIPVLLMIHEDIKNLIIKIKQGVFNNTSVKENG
ncbi:AcrB/AcrD/AcrF family protein [Marinomonas sp. MED121]|uniref:efflux RND transporter permease subunit n=1 Tax=Marinomonas sp. MED121 TaxID=314277 RepID=UPI000069115B|nr:efflux RND transporter permease subunit [Marinomonas sp. MED121]EAQ67239.1 AcrB/AcrD/AcrF family protein [Marinomonas sp. MED121]